MNVTFLLVAMVVGVLIWIFVFIYDLWSPVIAETTYRMDVYITNDTNASGDLLTNAQTSLENTRSVWRYWPYVLFFFLLLWLYVAIQDTEPMHQGYSYG